MTALRPPASLRPSRPALLSALLLAALAAPAPAEPIRSVRLSGGSEALWLLAHFGDRRERLAVKPINQPWQTPVERGFTDVAVLAGAGDGVMLVLHGGALLRCYTGQEEALPSYAAPAALWPKGSVPLATAAGSDRPTEALYVLIRRPVGRRPPATAPSSKPTTTGPATQPATAPVARTRSASTSAGTRRIGRSSTERVVLRYDSPDWQEVAPLPDEPGSPERPAWLAVADGKLYALLGGDRLSLWERQRDSWAAVPLPPDLEEAKPLLLTGLGGTLVLTAMDVGSAGQVGIARRTAGKWIPVQTVHADEKPTTWPAEHPPVAGRLGENVALVWSEKGVWQFGRVSPDGRMKVSDLDVFAGPVSTEAAGQIVQVYVLSAMGVIVLLLFWPGRPIVRTRFALPVGVLPAEPDRRALAFLVDIVPFALAGALAGSGGDMQILEDAANSGVIPDRLVYFSLALVLGAYPLYCIVAEALWGQTLGKRLLRLRVAGDRGRAPTLREVMIRNICKIPELGVFILVALVFLTRYRQRAGDLLARTAVIDTRIVVPTEPPAGPQPPADSELPGESDREDDEEKL